MKETLRIIAEEFNYLNEEKKKIENKSIKTKEDIENLKAIEELYSYMADKTNNWTNERNKKINEVNTQENKDEQISLRERFEQGRDAIEKVKNQSKSLQPKIEGKDKKRKDEILKQAGFIETSTVDGRSIRIHPSLVGKYYDLVTEQRRLSKELNEEYYRNRDMSFKSINHEVLEPIEVLEPSISPVIENNEIVSTVAPEETEITSDYEYTSNPTPFDSIKQINESSTRKQEELYQQAQDEINRILSSNKLDKPNLSEEYKTELTDKFEQLNTELEAAIKQNQEEVSKSVQDRIDEISFANNLDNQNELEEQKQQITENLEKINTELEAAIKQNQEEVSKSVQDRIDEILFANNLGNQNESEEQKQQVTDNFESLNKEINEQVKNESAVKLSLVDLVKQHTSSIKKEREEYFASANIGSGEIVYENIESLNSNIPEESKDNFEKINNIIIEGMQQEEPKEEAPYLNKEVTFNPEEDEELIKSSPKNEIVPSGKKEIVQINSQNEELINSAALEMRQYINSVLPKEQESEKKKPIRNFITNVRKRVKPSKKFNIKEIKVALFAIVTALTVGISAFGIASSIKNNKQFVKPNDKETVTTLDDENNVFDKDLPPINNLYDNIINDFYNNQNSYNDIFNNSNNSIGNNSTTDIETDNDLEYLDKETSSETMDTTQQENEYLIGKIGNTITVQEGTRICDDEYDAYYRDNSIPAYYKFDEPRVIVGVAIIQDNKMNSIFASDENYEQKVNNLIQNGGELVSVLTANKKYLPDWDGKTPLMLDEIRAYNEGWYNINDIVDTNVKGIQR